MAAAAAPRLEAGAVGIAAAVVRELVAAAVSGLLDVADALAPDVTAVGADEVLVVVVAVELRGTGIWLRWQLTLLLLRL